MEILDRDQVSLYRESGFVLAKRFLSHDQLDLIGGEIGAIIAAGNSSGAVFYCEPENRQLTRRIEALSKASSPLQSFLQLGRVAMAVERLMGDRALLFKDKINMKQAGGAGFSAHIDGHFLWTDQHGHERRGWAEYADFFVNALIPLDRADEENGCLEIGTLQETEVLLGTEFDQVVSVLEGKGPGLSLLKEGMIAFQQLIMDPGDVAFFDWRVPHRSGPNHTARCRRIIYATYNRAAAGDHYDNYFRDKAMSHNSEREKSSI